MCLVSMKRELQTFGMLTIQPTYGNTTLKKSKSLFYLNYFLKHARSDLLKPHVKNNIVFFPIIKHEMNIIISLNICKSQNNRNARHLTFITNRCKHMAPFILKDALLSCLRCFTIFYEGLLKCTRCLPSLKRHYKDEQCALQNTLANFFQNLYKMVNLLVLMLTRKVGAFSKQGCA